MSARSAHRLLRATLILALALACLPTPAVAAPKASAAQIEAKKAEEAAARAELDAMRMELAEQVSQYIEVAKEMRRTERDISEITTQMAQLDVQLYDLETSLHTRAVELYTGQRIDMLYILLNAASVQDLFERVQYLALVSYRDSKLLESVRLTRSENLWLQESMAQRRDRLTQLALDADQRRSQIETALAEQQKKTVRLGGELARLIWSQSDLPSGSAPPNGGFTPDTVISEANYRASRSMTATDVQAFLEMQPGALKHLRTRDFSGKTKSAAEMIAEAGVAWGVSPKVIMATLQKEQSLLTRGSPTQRSLDWAMGCGKTDSRTFTKYQGFGKQVYYGAQKLRQNADRWSPGATLKIDGSYVTPSNTATYGQYKYTPHFHGVMSFWLIYWRYFGDPLN